MALLVTPGQFGDAPQMIEVLSRIRVPRPQGGHPRTRPDHLSGDKAYSSRRNRRYLRRRQIKHTIPEPKDQRAHRKRRGSKAGRPPASTTRPTNAATRSNGPSTGSRTPGPSPPVTTRGPTSSTAPPSSPRSVCGFAKGSKPALSGEGVLQRRDARRQQRIRVPRDRAPSEPEHLYLVLMARVLVIANMEEPVGARSNRRHMLEQTDNIRRRAVIGMASQVDERLAVHPPEVKKIGAVHLGDAKPKLIDDLPQSDLIVVINCGIPDRDPAVVLEHTPILTRTGASH